MDAQEMHDYETRGRAARMEVASKETLEALLAEKNGPSREPPKLADLDPIARAVAQNPGLTREKAVEMAEKLGF